MKKNFLSAGSVLSITFVAIAALCAMFYHSYAKAINAARAEIAAVVAREADLADKILETPEPEKEIERLSKQVEELKHRLPDESHIGWVSATLAEAMHAHKMDLRSASDWVDFGPGPAQGLRRLNRTISVSGSAESFQEFLRGIDCLPFAVVVDDVAVLRESNNAAITATVKLTTYVLRTTKPAVQDKT